MGEYVTILCKHEGKVRWSTDRDGTSVHILTAEKDGETRKLISDPHNRYSLLGDFSLHIKNVSNSDSGFYYCNTNPTVNLIVKEPDQTTGFSHSQPEDTTPTQGPSAKKSSDIFV